MKKNKKQHTPRPINTIGNIVGYSNNESLMISLHNATITEQEQAKRLKI